MPSVYIHIPFCQSRCIYCDFYSTTHIVKQEQYVDCLIREMRSRLNEWPLHDDLSLARAQTLSIYLGGGTPSTLPAPLLQHLLKTVVELFPPTQDAEITIEANPDDVTEQWVEMLKQTPVNRVSMGVQTFHDDLLHTLRRRHTAEHARHAVALLKKAGYHNLSIDLIYGLPGQTLEDWSNDIDAALSLGVPHLSAYSLMYEEGTPLMRLLEEGKVCEMSDDESWQCYDMLCKRLAQAGYEHYEISNFALPNHHSRHNSGYWEGTLYLGFGAGAHSYDGRRLRRCNVASLQDYLDALEQDCPSTDYYDTESLNDTDLYNEFVMTRMRTSKGVLLEELASRFGAEAYNHFMKMIQPHLQKGNLLQTGSSVCLTRRGIFVSNDVISDLFL